MSDDKSIVLAMFPEAAAVNLARAGSAANWMILTRPAAGKGILAGGDTEAEAWRNSRDYMDAGRGMARRGDRG